MQPEKRNYAGRRFGHDRRRHQGKPAPATCSSLSANRWARMAVGRLRLYVKPFIRWIWLGALIMAIGGFTVAFDKRFRRQAASE